MRKSTLLGTLLSITLIMLSCENHISDDCNLKTENQSSNTLSENEAINIVKSFQMATNGEIVSSRAEIDNPVTYNIGKKIYISQNSRMTRSFSDANTFMYEVQITNGAKNGRALVSGDKRFPEVIAYIPTYNDTVNSIVTASAAMTQMAINTYIENLNNYKEEQSTRSTPIQDIDRPLMMVGPFCGTEWDQFEPYNLAYPKNWVDIFFGYCSYTHYPTGCAVTAIAQIMAAVEPNMTCAGLKMDWNYLKQNKTINNGPFGTPDPQDKLNMVSALFKDIYDKTYSTPMWGTGETDEYPSQQVSCVIGVSTTSSNVYSYLNSRSNVTYCSSYQKWNLDVVRNSLYNIRPVFVGGNNHAFVIDGYAVNRSTSSSNNVYFHCCFGWGGYSDGYYLVNSNGSVSFETGSGTYTDTQLSIIPDIRKR